MSLCQDCKDKKFCSTPCAALNKYLKDNGIYSADYIRPRISSSKRGEGVYREIPVEDIDNTATQRAINLRGRKKSVKKYSETA